GDSARALDYYTRSLTLFEEIETKQGIAQTLKRMGDVHYEQGDYASAIAYNSRSLSIAQEIGLAEETRDAAQALYELYKATNRQKPALEMYELYITTRDSINSEENQKEVIRQKYKYEYDKQAIADSVAYIQVQKVQQAKLEKSKTQQLALIIGVILLLVFLAYMYNRFRVTRKQKLIISEQNKELATATELAETANSELQTKSEELEKFNTVMLDREMRIIELKKEVNNLAKTNDTGTPYPEIGDK
ncbi:MAG: tetratricopeptide repeat protein, partial [Bacteroidetes bacterium]|nr:tetratricopeptide repeat protein [Bacteroidota bacterium]